MKRKWLVSAMLGLLVVSELGATIYAEEKETEVTYDVQSSYTLSIPAKVDLSTSLFSRIGTTYHNIEPNKKLDISLSANNSSIDNEGKIFLTRKNDSTSHTLTTTVSTNGDPLGINSTVLSIIGTQDTGETTSLTFSPLAGTKKAGNYAATIHFAAEIKNK